VQNENDFAINEKLTETSSRASLFRLLSLNEIDKIK
jgi:hypothetical protein